MLPDKQIHILVGASGAGKTFFYYTMLEKHFKTHEPWPLQLDPLVESVGIIGSDRAEGEQRHHIKKLGLQNEVELVTLVESREVTLQDIARREPVATLAKLYKKFKKKHRVIIVDPIGPLVPGCHIDYQNVCVNMVAWNRFACDHDITIIGCHHAAKQKTDSKFLRPQDRISGSAAFQGFSGTHMVLIQGEEHKDKVDYDTFIIQPHLAKREEIKLARRGDGYFEIYDDSQEKNLRNWLTSQPSGLIFWKDIKKTAFLFGIPDDRLTEWDNKWWRKTKTKGLVERMIK